MCSNSHPFIRTCFSRWEIWSIDPAWTRCWGFVEGLCQTDGLIKRWDVLKLGSFPSFFVLFLGESGGWKLHPNLAGHVWGCWILESTDSTPLDVEVGYKTMWTRQFFSKLRWFGGAMGFRKHPNKVISNLGFVGFFVVIRVAYLWQMCGLMTYQEVTGTLPFAGSFVKFGTQGTKSCDLRDLAVEKKIRDPIRFLRNRSLQTLINFIVQLPASWYTFP